MKNLLLFSLVFIGLSSSTLPTYSDEICLSAEEMKLYKLLMDYRRGLGLNSIPISAKLTKVAQVHAKDLSEHHDPTDKTCNMHSWSDDGEWSSCCYTADHAQAECMWKKPKEIAGYENFGYEISYYSEAGANAVHGIEGWKKSKSHNEVMANLGIWKDVSWKAVGIGFYKDYGVVWFGETQDDERAKQCR